jgi:cystathionine beta-lyase
MPRLLDFDTSDLRARTGEKWHHYDSDVLAAWVADMDFPIAEPLQALLQQTADRTDVGYPINPSPEGLPTVFAERAAERWGWAIDPPRIEVITDVVQGMYVAIETLSEPGDRMIVQTPIYPPFLKAVRELKRELLDAELVRGESRYEIDFDALRKAADGRTRMLLLCNPHNPTGRVFDRTELEGLAEIVLEHDLYVMSDEIHSDLVYAPHEHIPFATLGPEVEARTVTLTSATKAFNIAGLRCAVAVFGSDELRRRFRSIPPAILGGLGSLGLAATRIAWQECDDWLQAVRAQLAENRDFVASFVRDRLPGVRHLPPEATYLAWLDCNDLGLEPNPFRHFLDRARVALSEGPRFGPPGRGFVRLNFATNPAVLTQILERMEKSLG